nr:hypothetical protein [Wohlfahrtiimonas chitiniclastica]
MKKRCRPMLGFKTYKPHKY